MKGLHKKTICKNCGNGIYKTFDKGMWHHLDMEPMTDTMEICGMPEPVSLPLNTLDEIAALANDAGAQGIWVIRGANNARFVYEPENNPIRPNIPGVVGSASLSLSLDIADAGIVVLIRFPFSDGNSEPGIEVK